MALTVSQVIGQAKSAPRALKVFAAIAAIDLIVLLFAALLLEDQVGNQTAQVEQLKAQLTAARAKVETTRKQIDRLPELRQLYDAAISDGVLADQDRLKFVSRAQDLAKQYRLSDLHYKLDPEDSTPLNPSAFHLVTTPIILTGAGLLDTDVLAFWEDLLGKLQAHYQVTKATLARSDTGSQEALGLIRQGQPVSLVKAELEFRWVSLRKASEGNRK